MKMKRRTTEVAGKSAAAPGSDPILADASVIAELDRRWQLVENGRATVPNAQVERWLGTWGTSAFRRWSSR
jgi:hypothetical protein